MPKRLLAIFMFFTSFIIATVMVHSITWCHDYTIYIVTGKDFNKTSPNLLRKYLTNLKYKRHSFTTAAHNPRAQTNLRPGDVIIIGNAHSGVVNGKGLIDHFIQRFGASGTAYTPKKLGSMRNFKRNWTLVRMMNFQRITPDGRKIYPYRKMSIEVWRSKEQTDPMKHIPLNGIWQGVRDPKYIATIGGSGRSISYSGTNGVFEHSGTLRYDPLKKVYCGDLYDNPSMCCGNDGEMLLKVKDANTVMVTSKWWQKGTSREKIVFSAGWQPLKRKK